MYRGRKVIRNNGFSVAPLRPTVRLTQAMGSAHEITCIRLFLFSRI